MQAAGYLSTLSEYTRHFQGSRLTKRSGTDVSRKRSPFFSFFFFFFAAVISSSFEVATKEAYDALTRKVLFKGEK